MSIMPGTPYDTATDVSMTPVILPSGLPGSSSTNSRRLGERQASRVERFSFPAVPPDHEYPAAQTPPGAVWPKCDCTESVQAGIELADAICANLSPHRPAVLALTSPSDGDGKTGVLTVLAPELARRIPAGVLTVDADFRKADLTSLLTLAASRVPEGVRLIYPTDIAGLNVLPMPPGLQTHYFDAAWVKEIRKNGPLTILDMASLEHPETVSLLQHCDAVYLVVRLGHTSRRAVAEAGRVIKANGGRLLGSVVVG